MKTVSSILLLISLLMVITACGNKEAGRAEKADTEPDVEEEELTVENEVERNTYTLSSTVEDVISDPYFEDFGYLLFPVDRSVSEDMTLEEISSSSVYVWYNYIDPDKTVEIIQDLHDRAAAGKQIFYDIYTEQEKEADPSKEDTGLFFFKGEPGEKFAVINAGGGFM